MIVNKILNDYYEEIALRCNNIIKDLLVCEYNSDSIAATFITLSSQTFEGMNVTHKPIIAKTEAIINTEHNPIVIEDTDKNICKISLRIQNCADLIDSVLIPYVWKEDIVSITLKRHDGEIIKTWSELEWNKLENNKLKLFSNGPMKMFNHQVLFDGLHLDIYIKKPSATLYMIEHNHFKIKGICYVGSGQVRVDIYPEIRNNNLVITSENLQFV